MCCDNIFEINVITFNSYAVNNNLVTTYGGDGMFAFWNLSIYICLSFVHANSLACDLMLAQFITCWLLSHKLSIWISFNENNVFFVCNGMHHAKWHYFLQMYIIWFWKKIGIIVVNFYNNWLGHNFNYNQCTESYGVFSFFGW